MKQLQHNCIYMDIVPNNNRPTITVGLLRANAINHLYYNGAWCLGSQATIVHTEKKITIKEIYKLNYKLNCMLILLVVYWPLNWISGINWEVRVTTNFKSMQYA